MCEDALRDGALACVVAEVKAADQTATRRLQLAASEGKTPMLLYRRYRRYGQCPLTDLSLACTRWRIGSLASAPLSMPGVGRSEEHTSELQSLMRISYAVFCLKKKKNKNEYYITSPTR